MGSISAVRAGLKTRLATITGLNAHALAPPVVVTPCAFVIPRTPAVEYDEAMARGSDMFNFTVVVLVGKVTDQLAQEHLDPYLNGSGAQSIKAAIEGDGTLGGAADWTRVTSVASYGEVDYLSIQYLGARFNVEVDVDGA